MDKKVSIIVPVYKAEKFINRCVDSLLRQTYENIEIILIEDGSSDKSGEMIDKIDDSRVKVIHNKKSGVSRTRNVGLGLATGDYVTFCDSDDYYSDDHVEKMLLIAEKKDADIVISGYYAQNGESFNSSVKMESHSVSNDEIVKHFCIDNEFGGFCWNKLYRRDVICNDQFPEDLDILEDTYFLCLGMKKSRKIYYLAEPLYYYCTNQDSAVRNIDNLFSNSNTVKYIDSYEKIMNDFDFSLRAKNNIESTIYDMAVYFRKMELQGLHHGSEELMNYLNSRIKKYYSVYYRNSDIPLKKKIKSTLQFIIPRLRKMFKNINR
ncbi:glycosyltransferase [Ligilactobacillus equi]|uniref:glycosyltransferase family 2 protein n=1 Tax=Ligilactobacillus equi TaxID=137357 RepID=UPI002ED4A723